jgi:hypothetical protein
MQSATLATQALATQALATQALATQSLEDETEEEYNRRNSDNINKCLHDYTCQDHLRIQKCNFCGCLYYNVYPNQNYNIYFDDYS